MIIAIITGNVKGENEPPAPRDCMGRRAARRGGGKTEFSPPRILQNAAARPAELSIPPVSAGALCSIYKNPGFPASDFSVAENFGSEKFRDDLSGGEKAGAIKYLYTN